MKPRAASALGSSQARLITDLETAVAGGDEQKRVDSLRRIADLFLGTADTLDEAQIELFGDVISRLALAIETSARAELSEQLAHVANTPPAVARALAHDPSIEVAGPMLQHSPRLTSDDLVSIAQHSGQAHLLAISGRSSIDTAVTDVLVARGDRQVLHRVASNEGARFSETGFDRLVERSEGDDDLAAQVGLRRDIPPRQFEALLKLASDKVCARLAAHAPDGANGDIIRRKIGEIATRVTAQAPTRARDYSSARRHVLSLVKGSRLDGKAIQTMAQYNHFEDVVAALAHVCNIPIETVERVLTDARPDGVLIMTKAAGFSWPETRDILRIRLGREEPVGIAESEIAVAFMNLSQTTARRALRFWQVRQAVAAD